MGLSVRVRRMRMWTSFPACLFPYNYRGFIYRGLNQAACCPDASIGTRLTGTCTLALLHVPGSRFCKLSAPRLFFPSKNAGSNAAQGGSTSSNLGSKGTGYAPSLSGSKGGQGGGSFSAGAADLADGAATTTRLGGSSTSAGDERKCLGCQSIHRTPHHDLGLTRSSALAHSLLSPLSPEFPGASRQTHMPCPAPSRCNHASHPSRAGHHTLRGQESTRPCLCLGLQAMAAPGWVLRSSPPRGSLTLKAKSVPRTMQLARPQMQMPTWEPPSRGPR
jgi:hypothetical protein